MNKKIAIVNTQSTFNTPSARESLDLALIFGAFDHQVSVIFLADGIYQLIAGQRPEQLQSKDFLATMKAFELYDIDQIVCCSRSLLERGIEPETLQSDVATLSPQQINSLLQTVDHVVMQ